jgi:putative membrane protein
MARNNSWWKRYLLGLAGGAAGTAAMNYYMKAAKKLSNGGGAEPKEHDISIAGRRHAPGEPATAAIGRLAYRKVTGRDPDDRTKSKLSNLVHWGYGIDMGTTYALLRGRQPRLDWAGGLAFGAALWVLGDEIAVPLLGFAEGPKAYPKSLHAETLGAHLVYGITTAATTQLLQRRFR